MRSPNASRWVLGAALAATASCGSSAAGPGFDGAAIHAGDAALDHVRSTADAGSLNSDAVTLDAADAADGDAAAAETDAAVITPDLCAQKCAVMAQIDCPDAQTVDYCVAACIDGASDCTAETLAYYQCLLAQGAAALVCDESLQAVVFKPGFCTQQSSDLYDCAAAL